MPTAIPVVPLSKMFGRRAGSIFGQKQHRTLWHFIPGLALSAVITGVALWGGSIPAVAGAGFSALTLAILLGMVLGNTISST